MSFGKIEENRLLDRLALCMPPDGPPEFHEVPLAVVREMDRRTQTSKKFFLRALAAEKFLKRLAMEGGQIVSSSALTPGEVKAAHDEGRMFVAPDGLGYAILPPAESEREK